MTTRNVRTAYLHAITPLHCGTGQASAVVDLPIAREKATGWPVVPASSLRGVLHAKYAGENWVTKAFGEAAKKGDKDSEAAGPTAGALVFTDLRILCLPVRSFHGTFAWVTCPLALQRFQRDAAAMGAGKVLQSLPQNLPLEAAHLPKDSELVQKERVVFEDLDLKAVECSVAGETAVTLASAIGLDEKIFTARFAVVSDAVFDFLCETGTEVSARICLGEEGSTSGKGGNLWYEERVPAEAVFVGWILGDSESRIETQTIQVGGNAGTGNGLCSLVVQP
jgi:CRISPR-associated protein Cmr4